jgi:outer membrane protein
MTPVEMAMQKPLIAVLLAGAFFTLDAGAADLIQVYQQALANDATYASARASAAAGRERSVQGRAGLLPNIALSGGITRAKSDNSSGVGQVITDPNGIPTAVTGGNTYGTNKEYTIALQQPLFRWDLWQTYEQSKLQQSITEAQFAQAQQDLITRVAQAYFDVLSAQDTLASTRAQKVATTEQLASAKRNFEVGTQTITDTHEAQAAYDLVVSQELAAVNDLENKKTALQAIIGTPPAALATLRPGVTLKAPEPVNIDQWVSAAENQNYAVTAAQLSVEVAKREISRQRAGHYPTLDLTVASTHTDASRTIQPYKNTTNSVGIQYNIPIFSGFAVTSRVRESIALEDRARNDLEANRRNAALTARQSFLGVNTGLAQVKALEAAEVSSNSALESNKLGYQVGVRINIDVLNAQRQLYQTQTDLARARYNTILSGLRLKAAAGSLREEDLQPINALLQQP